MRIIRKILSDYKEVSGEVNTRKHGLFLYAIDDESLWIAVLTELKKDGLREYRPMYSHGFAETFDKNRRMMSFYERFSSLEDAKSYIEKILKDNGFSILKDNLEIFT